MKAVTIRLPEDVILRIEREAQEEKKEKGTLIREALIKGLAERNEERLALRYRAGEVSESEICRNLGISRWEFLDFLARRQIARNVTFEDYLDSGSMNS